jgi:N-acyl-D-aspartate/D-glutamate deacylase
VIVLLLLLGAQEADVLIRGGLVYDGTAAEARRADVAIRGDRIVAAGAAKRVIDADGKIVCPGFIDLHTHSDTEILQEGLRENTSYVTQGCSTIVTGNCGGGQLDVAAYFAALEKNGAGTNVAHLVPHNAVRQEAMGGSFNRLPTPAELDAMKALVARGMEAGAFGISTGLIYTPGTYAKTDELAALAEAARGGLYASHIRSEGDDLTGAVAEAIEIGRRSGAPVHISHFKASGPPNWGKVKEAAALVERARAEGRRVTADQYPYVASSTSLAAMVIPTWAREGKQEDLIKRLDDPEAGPKIRAAIVRAFAERGGGDTIKIAGFKADPSYNGRSIAELARATGREPADVAIDIQRRGGAGAVSFGMCDADVEFVMTRDYVATASDGSSKRPDGTVPHPRSYGTFPRKIGLYALEKKVLPLGQAVRSCTGLPASILGLKDRGTIAEGAFADVVIFDPARLRDRATYENPHQHSAGVEWLFVNGTAVVAEGKPTGALPGRPLRRN